MSNSFSWDKVRLVDIAAPKKYALAGGPFGSNLVSKDYKAAGVPVIRGSNLNTESTFSFEDFVFVSEEKADALLPNNAHPGDLVFTQRGTLGQIGIIPKECGYDRFVISQSQMKLTVNEEKAVPFFVYLFFRSPETVQAIQSRAITSGVPHINLEILKNFEIPLPPIYIQRRIADILSNYDRLIDNNNRRIALLEESIHRLYKEWFVHLRFPGWEKVAIVDGVPEGWGRKPLEEICELVMGQSPPSTTYNTLGQGLPFHQGVTNFGLRFVSHETYCTQPNRTAQSGDILCSVRAPVGRLNITLDKIIIGRGLAAIRNRQGFQSFQFYQLKNYFFQEDLIGGGAIFASVTKKQLSEQEMLYPCEATLQGFENIAKPVDQQITNLNSQNQKLREARDLLLPRLMNGCIAV